LITGLLLISVRKSVATGVFVDAIVGFSPNKARSAIVEFNQAIRRISGGFDEILSSREGDLVDRFAKIEF